MTDQNIEVFESELFALKFNVWQNLHGKITRQVLSIVKSLAEKLTISENVGFPRTVKTNTLKVGNCTVYRDASTTFVF